MDSTLMRPHEWESLLRYLAERHGTKLVQSDVIKVYRVGTDDVFIHYQSVEHKNSYVVKSQSAFTFSYKDYQQWLLDSFDDYFDKSTGGAMSNPNTTFPARRGFPVSNSSVTAFGKPIGATTATEIQPKLAPQRSILTA